MQRERLEDKPKSRPLFVGFGELQHPMKLGGKLAITKVEPKEITGTYGWQHYELHGEHQYIVVRNEGGTNHVLAQCDDRELASKLSALLNQAHHRVTSYHDHIRLLLSHAYLGGVDGMGGKL